MKTRLTTSPAIAAGFIKRGEVVAFPTETVYGLGADLFNPSAIARIFEAKGRPADNPLIAHISSIDQVELVSDRPGITARRLIEAFFPGPLTIVVRKKAAVPAIATGGLETIGIRMPRHEAAQALIAHAGVPLAAPSANVSGRPSPTTWDAVRQDLDGRIACILKGDQTEVGLESTVVDCTRNHPVILRSGAVTLEQVRSVTPRVQMAESNSSDLRRSPGTRYRHYAPAARVRLVRHPDDQKSSGRCAFIGLSKPNKNAGFEKVRICSSVPEYARSLFSFFRWCDEKGIGTIYCEMVPEEGLGVAIMDRLKRAAGRYEGAGNLHPQ